MVRLALLSFVLAGCAVRAAPYRFAGPVVAGVSLDERAEHGRARRPYDDGVRIPDTSAIAITPPEVPPSMVSRTKEQDTAVATRLWSEDALPEPHRQPKAQEGEARIEVAGVDSVAHVRAMVGSRDGRTDVAFAIAVAGALRGAKALGAADGPALVELARQQGATRALDADVRAGDLLVFDRARDDQPASLVAVALGKDDRGVVEMVYLARGVVRRGFVDVTRPRTRRDGDGRVVNTFLRHTKDHPPDGTRFLAGELLAHVIAWDLLTSTSSGPGGGTGRHRGLKSP